MQNRGPLSYRAAPRKAVLVIAGPTAIGKTALSLTIARHLDGEIISADPFQVYRGMDIGTAKVTLAARREVPHHLIDSQALTASSNVQTFYRAARPLIEQLLAKDKVPIIVGGSGFYLHALLYSPPRSPPPLPAVREAIEEQIARYGVWALYQKLQRLDPKYAATITWGDRQKIARGLEIIAVSGRPVSHFTQSVATPLPDYDWRCWLLHARRELLYARIEQRCHAMLATGLLAEVRQLLAMGLRANRSAAQAIGYRHCIRFLDSQQTADDWERCHNDFIRDSRRYAKRQLSWFRRESLFRWLDITSPATQPAAIILDDWRR